MTAVLLLLFVGICKLHGKLVPIHHGVVHPRVVDGGDDLRIWKVAANTFSKQSLAAKKGWYSSLRVGRGINNSPYKKSLSECYTKPRTWTDSSERPEIRKFGMKFGTWNNL